MQVLLRFYKRPNTFYVHARSSATFWINLVFIYLVADINNIWNQSMLLSFFIPQYLWTQLSQFMFELNRDWIPTRRGSHMKLKIQVQIRWKVYLLLLPNQPVDIHGWMWASPLFLNSERPIADCCQVVAIIRLTEFVHLSGLLAVSLMISHSLCFWSYVRLLFSHWPLQRS